jgi:hypothetical protein
MKKEAEKPLFHISTLFFSTFFCMQIWGFMQNDAHSNYELLVGTGGLLRFGHARGLTAHLAVIQHLRAASLPRLSAKA